MLVGIASYAAITGDASGMVGGYTGVDAAARITGSLNDAQSTVERYLRHPIECAQRTESLRAFPPYGRVYPNATPILSVSVPAGVTPDGYGVRASGGFFFAGTGFISGVDPSDPYTRVDTTYVGGWIGDDDYTALTAGIADLTPFALPIKVRRAIAYIAMADLAPPSAVPLGAVSVKNGDISVTYGHRLSADMTQQSWLRSIKGYRRMVGNARQ